MYLSELQLHGFKSFAQRTKVRFDTGITAIVGPNGCGKSNIVDSLRWVLGEQRPSLLRSSSMSNVIFNGSATRRQLGLAEVSLTVLNNKGVLPTEYNDVTITRRLYRSGESEYLLNNTVCRLKDIIDLFMDTGMGANAYSVIELKMVEDILSDKNADRRRLFEEAAGVTKYKERRRLTLKKLDETRTDLLRVEDILVEVRKKVRSLELQAQRAEKAKEHRTRLQEIELGLARHDYQKLVAELEPLLSEIKEAEQIKESAGREVEKREHSLQLSKQELLSKEQQKNKAQQALLHLENQIREHRNQVEITRVHIRNEENTIRQYEEDISQADREIHEHKNRISSTQESLTIAGKDLESVQARKEEAEQQYHHRLDQTNQLRAAVDQLTQRQQNINQELSRLNAQKVRKESRIESLSEELSRTQGQWGHSGSDFEDLSERLEILNIDFQERYSVFQVSDTALERGRQKRETIFQEQNKFKDLLREARSQYDALESEIALYQSIANSHESFPSGVQFLLEHEAEFSRLKVVSDVFSTSETYALALDAALGIAAGFVIVADGEEAERGIALLQEHKKGKVTFIPLNHLPQETPIDADALYHRVKCDAEFEPAKRVLLGQVLAFNDAKEARQYCRNKNKLGVTLNGEVVTSQGFYRGGSTAPNEGVRLALRDKLEKLERKALDVDQLMSKHRTQLDDFDAQIRGIDLDALQRQAKQSERDLEEIRTRRNTLQTRLNMIESSRGDQKKRLEALNAELETYKAELAEAEPHIARLEKEVNEMISKQVDQRNQLRELEENRTRAQEHYNTILQRFQEVRGRVENDEKDIDRAHQSITAVKERLNQRSETAKRSKDVIIEHRERIVILEDELASFNQRLKGLNEKHEALREVVLSERSKMDEVERSIRQLRQERELAVDRLHTLTLTRQQRENRLSAISDGIWQEYALLMDQIEQELPENLDPNQARSEVGTLKQKLKNLGEVNPLAIEEFEQEKERLDEMERQLDDLNQAEADLRQTIDEINETATQRFNETFNQIRTNFREVFKTLFQADDECDLLIDEDQDDPLDAKIEIIAKPRGKKPSGISQLSGGEKTLTAIALLFGIYLVKPSPFCILDEVDAPLDDANIERFARILNRFSDQTQFIVITHNKKTMEKANMMYGVTMQESGVSQLVGVRVDEFE